VGCQRELRYWSYPVFGEKEMTAAMVGICVQEQSATAPTMKNSYASRSLSRTSRRRRQQFRSAPPYYSISWGVSSQLRYDAACGEREHQSSRATEDHADSHERSDHPLHTHRPSPPNHYAEN